MTTEQTATNQRQQVLGQLARWVPYPALFTAGAVAGYVQARRNPHGLSARKSKAAMLAVGTGTALMSTADRGRREGAALQRLQHRLEEARDAGGDASERIAKMHALRAEPLNLEPRDQYDARNIKTGWAATAVLAGHAAGARLANRKAKDPKTACR